MHYLDPHLAVRAQREGQGDGKLVFVVLLLVFPPLLLIFPMLLKRLLPNGHTV